MGLLEIVKPKILGLKKIPFVSPFLSQEFGTNPNNISLGLISSDIEHALITALDEATKKSDAEVILNTSFYAGVNPSQISGEILGIFSGENPIVIDNALKATVDYLNEMAYYQSINNCLFFSHVIGRIGRLLSNKIGLAEGESIAYLVAPPFESILAFDFAIKNSDTKLVQFLKPPTLTNQGGGFLTGSLSDCIAASQAFTEKIIEINNNPIESFI